MTVPKDKLTELQEDFDERGEAAIEELRERDPALYAEVLEQAMVEIEEDETEEPQRAQFTVNVDPDDTEGQAISRVLTKPEFWASETIDLIAHRRSQSYALNDLINELSDQVELRKSGDHSRDAEILNAQAHTLDMLFNVLAQMSISNFRSGYLEGADRLMKLALRSQTQCRNTLKELSSADRPVIKQTNIAHGHQQVNNFSETRAGRNELLEDDDGERLEPGAPSEAVRGDQTLETVEKEHGAEDA